MNRIRTTFLAALLGGALLLGNAAAQEKDLLLCWAAENPPADALAELSKDFTARTGINVRLNLLDRWRRIEDPPYNRPLRCDLYIGDNKWIGGSAENGHYVKLNEFFDKNGIKMSDFVEASVTGYSEWPKHTPNYYALPAMGDAVGWVYRKDWFARPDLQAEFKKKHGRVLAPPKTWTELKEIAEFFQGRIIDGKTVYGAAIYTDRLSEGITMGVTSALYAWGFQYEDPKKPYRMDGFVNSKDAVEALKFYKSLYKCCTPPRHTNAYAAESLDAYKSGQVAMQMNWFTLFPGIANDPEVGGAKSGFFVNPSQKVAASTLGGQGISVVAYSNQRENALQYIKWFTQAEVQKRWLVLGGFSCHKAVLFDPGFPKSTPFAAEYLKAMTGAKGFWQEPIYATLMLDMQRRIHDHVVADKGTAKEALDLLLKDWTKDLKEAGKIGASQ